MHADVYNALDGQQQREEPHRARGDEQVDYDRLDAQDRDHAHEYRQSTGLPPHLLARTGGLESTAVN